MMLLKTRSLLEVIFTALLWQLTSGLIRARKGDTAVLSCNLPAPETSSSGQHVVEWVRQGYDIPILIQFGVHDPRVHPNYDGRVSLIRGTSLQVMRLELEDEGWYECRILPLDTASDQAERNGSWTKLSVTAPPVFTETPPVGVEVFLGRSAKLKCAARGNPRPTITWFKDGVPVRLSSTGKIANGSLSFHAVGRDASGLYQCRAFNSEGNVTRATKLKVIGPPVIISPPTDTVLNMSQDAKLKCQAEADPPNMTYVWQKHGQDIYHLESLKSRVKVIVDGTLLISRLTPGDSGNYTCMPTNGLPNPPSASAILTVQHPAEAMPMPRETFLPTGMRGIITCPVRAEPPSSHVKWSKDGKLFDLGMFPGWTLTVDGSIVIATANDDAAGVYTCTPYNSFGTMGPSEPTTVILQDPPSFKVSPRKEYRQDLGGTLVLPCQVEGFPVQKVIWKKVGTVSRSLFSQAGNGSLILQPLTKDHQGEWECSSSNRVAVVSARTTVLVLGTSPQQVSVVSVVPGVNQVNVSWVPGFDGGYTQKFTIWFKKTTPTKEDGKQEWLSFPVQVMENSLLVKDLLPATEYQFSVMAQNKIGSGPFSEIATAKTLDARRLAPLDFTGNVSANVNSEGIFLDWSMPQSHHVDGFIVQVRLEGGEWVNLKEDISPSQRQIALKELCKDCKYELRLLYQRGDRLSMPSPSITVSTSREDTHPSSSRLSDFPDQLMAGVMGGVGFLCLVLILILVTVCFIFHKRNHGRRQSHNDVPPALHKITSETPDNSLKQKLLPDPALSYTSSSSVHSTLEKSSCKDFDGQLDHVHSQTNPSSHPSLPESHLQRTSHDPTTPVEFIHRGPDGRFVDQPYETVSGTISQKDRTHESSHLTLDRHRSFGIHKSQSLRSHRDERRKPPFVLSVDLPPFGADFPSPNRVMAKHLSLNGSYVPIHKQELLEADQISLSSICSSSLHYPHSESTQQSTKQGAIHSTASTLVLQMEHEREQGNLSRCLTLAREREELERELRKYTVEHDPEDLAAHEYGIYPTSPEIFTPHGQYQVMARSVFLDNEGVFNRRAASCVPWEEECNGSSANVYMKDFVNEKKYRPHQQGFHSIQRARSQRSKSLDRGERKKSHAWDQRRSRTPVESNLRRGMDESLFYKLEPTKTEADKRTQIMLRNDNPHFVPFVCSSSGHQRIQRIDKSSSQIFSNEDCFEMSVDGPDPESPFSCSRASDSETLDRPILFESGNVGPRIRWRKTPKDPATIQRTKSPGSRSSHSLDSKLLSDEYFLPPDAWIDSLTLGTDSPLPSNMENRSKSSLVLQKDSLVPSESQSHHHHHQQAFKVHGVSTSESRSQKNLVSGHSAHTAISPRGSRWPLSHCTSLTAMPSGTLRQSQEVEKEDEDDYVHEVDVEINRYRKSSDTEGSYRSYASQSSGRGSMDTSSGRQLSLSPPLTSSPETTEDSDRELQERPRKALVSESCDWGSAYVPMHPVDLKASASASLRQKQLLRQEPSDSRGDLSLKRQSSASLPLYHKPESHLYQELWKSITLVPDPDADAVLF